MPEQLFVFTQMEFAWRLGPPDGRYLLRRRPDAEAAHIVVLGTLGARRALPSGERVRRRRLAGGRGRAGERRATPEPAEVVTARATIIDPVPLSAENQARAWLADLDREHDVRAAFGVLNDVLYQHRIATADPYVHEVGPGQALVIRAGWGGGEQVADGRWLHARELPWQPGGRRSNGGRRVIADRSAALRPLERLAGLLGARGRSLLCEELALRARLDLDHGRLAHAALELDHAYAAALAELRDERRQDLTIRLAELDQLRSGVLEQAGEAIPGGASGAGRELDAEVLEHALGRLEAALRARTATGFSLTS